VSRSSVTRFVNFVLKSIQLPDSHYLTAYINTNCGLQIQQYHVLFGIYYVAALIVLINTQSVDSSMYLINFLYGSLVTEIANIHGHHGVCDSTGSDLSSFHIGIPHNSNVTAFL
jgi:hypothetical protein